ncbi:MAG: helix-turn-helix domain-containing protein [Armatimonadetes bacterium]|nr:helix-turn-helix domain-containing protein [Armatimonadota bacterium]
MGDQIAGMFKALGDPTRLRIFNFLRSCCGPVAVDDSGEARPLDGPTVGEVCCHVTGGDRITSTISHHLKELRQAGIITMQRRGKHIVCAVDPNAIRLLVEHLTSTQGDDHDCCE